MCEGHCTMLYPITTHKIDDCLLTSKQSATSSPTSYIFVYHLMDCLCSMAIIARCYLHNLDCYKHTLKLYFIKSAKNTSREFCIFLCYSFIVCFYETIIFNIFLISFFLNLHRSFPIFFPQFFLSIHFNPSTTMYAAICTLIYTR